MAATRSPDDPASPVSASAPPPMRTGSVPATAADFRGSFGEELRQVLDVASWRLGGDLAEEYPRIEREVGEAIAQEDEHQRRIRTEVFPKLMDPASAPGCGVFAANMDVLRLIHRGLLFNGGVEACDGTVQVHDTLPLTIYQIGVSLVSYAGDQGTWQQRLFRRDLRQQGQDYFNQVFELLRTPRRSGPPSITARRATSSASWRGRPSWITPSGRFCSAVRKRSGGWGTATRSPTSC